MLRNFPFCELLFIKSKNSAGIIPSEIYFSLLTGCQENQDFEKQLN